MGFDAQRAAVIVSADVAGGGIVARYPGLVCVARSEHPQPLRQLLEHCAAVAGPDPGRVLARRLAMWLSDSDAPGEELVFGTVAAAGDRVAVFLSGAVEVVVAEQGVRLSGTHAAAWTDRLLDGPAAQIVLALDGTQAPSRPDVGLHDLRSGVVPGVGVVLVSMAAGAVPSVPVLQESGVRPETAGPDAGGLDVEGPYSAVLDAAGFDAAGSAAAVRGGDAPADADAPAGSEGDEPPEGGGTVDWFADAEPLSVDGPGDPPADGFREPASVRDGGDDGPGGVAPGGAAAEDGSPGEPGSAASRGRHVLLREDAGPVGDGPEEHLPAVGGPPFDGPGGDPPSTGRPAAGAADQPDPAEPAPEEEATDVVLPSTAAFQLGPDSGSVELPLPSRIRGLRCDRGHLSDPRSPVCIQCGVPMAVPPGPLVSGERPALGLLVFDDGATYTVDADYLVGRLPESDPRVRSGALGSIVVEDRSGAVSRAHAEIRIVGWDVLIQDAGSRNGTFVAEPEETGWTPVPAGGQRVLGPGARVRIGGRIFAFEPPAGVG